MSYRAVGISLAFLGTALALTGCATGEKFQSKTITSGMRVETVRGHLTRPEGEGPFPAAVLLHTCGGIYNTPDYTAMLTGMGFVTLMVDSFGPRGQTSQCNPRRGGDGGQKQVLDAFGALEHLAKQPYVDCERIVVLGWSLGGTSALGTVAAGGLGRYADASFKAAVAFYPKCSQAAGDFDAPVLVFVGDMDTWTPPGPCLRYVKGRRAGQSAAEVVIYPGAHHSFDLPGPRRMVEGYELAFDGVAAKDARDRVRQFLAKHLRLE